MPEKYTPPADKVAALVEKYTPSQLAAAYLRSQRRARSASAAMKIMGDISDISLGLATGNEAKSLAAIAMAKRRLHAHDDQST